VKQDLIAAYKWGELATRGGSGVINFEAISGQSTRNAAILKMNADQIAEANKQVAEFVPHQQQKSDLPEPDWVEKIKLNGINGTAENRLAIINGRTLGKDDRIILKIGETKTAIHCLEIRESSVVIAIDGLPGSRELKLP
jgi:hypothetical protein